MNAYYVVWAVYDADFEQSHTIYRAVLTGRAKSQVETRAKLLAPQVLAHHNKHDLRFKVNNVDEVEAIVRPLTEWVARLRQMGDELSLVEMDEA